MCKKHYTSIKEIIEKESKKNRYFKLEIIRNSWQKIVGMTLASKSYPIFIKDEIITICVENPVWITQMKFLENEIIKNINTQVNDFFVKKIKFTNKKGFKFNFLEEKINNTIDYNSEKIKLEKF